MALHHCNLSTDWGWASYHGNLSTDWGWASYHGNLSTDWGWASWLISLNHELDYSCRSVSLRSLKVEMGDRTPSRFFKTGELQTRRPTGLSYFTWCLSISMLVIFALPYIFSLPWDSLWCHFLLPIDHWDPLWCHFLLPIYHWHGP